MQFMILRKADKSIETEQQAGAALLKALTQYHQELAAAGVLRSGAGLAPSAQAVRLKLAGGEATVTEGPFPEVEQLVAGFSIIDVPSRQEALDWASRWPAIDGAGDVEIEVRETGCEGGCAEVAAPARSGSAAGQPRQQRFAILLKSDRGTESGIPPAQEKLDTLDRSNAAEARAGVLLAGEGLKASSKGARVKLAGGKAYTVDGPFTETKEMIAGYWLISVPSMQVAIAWARRNPYPTGPDVAVEIRPVYA
jgi:hypothetical protein